jgi:hypothetical protein
LNYVGLHSAFTLIRENVLAKPNYSFEKRQRDLEKKRKQDEKRLRKQADKKPAEGDDAVTDPALASDAGVSETAR